MSGPPPAKRLKQSTLQESFKLLRRKSEEAGISSRNMDQENTQQKELQQGKMSTVSEKKDETKEDSHGSNLQEGVVPSTSAECQGRNESQNTFPSTSSPELFSESSQDTVDNWAQDMDCESMEAAIVKETLDLMPESEPKSILHSQFGSPLSELNKNPGCSVQLSPLRQSSSHHILIKLPLRNLDVPMPYPERFRDKWDAYHVKMPCSTQSLYPGTDKGKKVLQDRWALIQLALKSDIHSTHDLEESILAYNSRYSDKWNFGGLHHLFKKLAKEETEAFFQETLPKMVNLALQIPDICTQAVPLLKKHKDLSVTLSQQQVACLLANAFFCTFPRRNARGKQSEYSSFPDINFNQLFAGSNKAEKLKCILHYFRRVTSEMPKGTVTFQRQCINDFPHWHKSKTNICKLHVTSSGTIEDDGTGMLQVDFANKFLGGGVLGHGCVQEEIRFLICPEMIVSRLITEVLDDNECLIMTGCEQFSSYTGYADTFKWSDNYVDKTPRDEWGRRCVQVVAIDALMIHNYNEQFKAFSVRRELNKAYCGFVSPSQKNKKLPAVATGNWGCGAFGGETQLKALIQLMAASEANRDVAYFTFNDALLAKEMNQVFNYIEAKDLRVCDLWMLINRYWQDRCMKGRPNQTLYDYICDGNKHRTAASKNPSTLQEGSSSPDWTANTP